MTSHKRQSPVRVLIAGGAGGVGLACADALASRGAELILCDTNGQALDAATRRLKAFGRFCDSIEEHSVAIFAAEIGEKFGSIDVLINGAGRGYVRALAMMRMTRAFMPLLRRAEGRRLLVNIAPAGGFAPSNDVFPYASSLGGFERLSEALAEQVKGTSIDVVTVAPTLMARPAAQTAAADALYRLHRVDERRTAEHVATLIAEIRGEPDSGSAPNASRPA